MCAGRDSVKGRKARNDVAPRAPVPQEVRDADFVHRLEEQLVRDRAFFDIDSLRHDFQALDSNRSGEISKETVSKNTLCSLFCLYYVEVR